MEKCPFLRISTREAIPSRVFCASQSKGLVYAGSIHGQQEEITPIRGEFCPYKRETTTTCEAANQESHQKLLQVKRQSDLMYIHLYPLSK